MAVESKHMKKLLLSEEGDLASYCVTKKLIKHFIVAEGAHRQ